MNGDEETAPASDEAMVETERLRLYRITGALIRLIELINVKYGSNSNGFVVGAITFFLSFEILTNLQLSYASEKYIIPFILGLLCALIYMKFERQRFRHKKIELLARINSANLIQRMAAGWNGFPIIHDYSPLLWRKLLGPRPRSNSEWTKVISYNLVWYLQPPQRLRIGRIPITNQLLVLFGIGLTLILWSYVTFYCWLYHHNDPEWPRIMYKMAVSNGIVSIIMAAIIIVLFLVMDATLIWTAPLKKLYAQTLLQALRDYQTQLQPPLPPPDASVPPARPPSPEEWRAAGGDTLGK
jgi:hypothetical protein